MLNTIDLYHIFSFILQTNKRSRLQIEERISVFNIESQVQICNLQGGQINKVTNVMLNVVVFAGRIFQPSYHVI